MPLRVGQTLKGNTREKALELLNNKNDEEEGREGQKLRVLGPKRESPEIARNPSSMKDKEEKIDEEGLKRGEDEGGRDSKLKEEEPKQLRKKT